MTDISFGMYLWTLVSLYPGMHFGLEVKGLNSKMKCFYDIALGSFNLLSIYFC